MHQGVGPSACAEEAGSHVPSAGEARVHACAVSKATTWHDVTQAGGTFAAKQQQKGSSWTGSSASGRQQAFRLFSLSPPSLPPLYSLSYSIFSLYNCCHLVVSDLGLFLLSLSCPSSDVAFIRGHHLGGKSA